MSYRSGALLTAVAFAWLAPQAPAEEINKHFHESFEVGPGDTLHLRHGDGDVEVLPWDEDVLDVDVRYRVDVTRIGLGTYGEFDVEFRQDGGGVYVTEKPRTSITIGFLYDREHEYQYTIRAPAYLGLDLDGDDGNVRVERWKGDLDCLLEDGDIDLLDLGSKRAQVRTGDGEVRVEGLEGELDVTSDDGGITIAGCREAKVRARTDDGDVRVRRCAGSFRIETMDGDVRPAQGRGPRRGRVHGRWRRDRRAGGRAICHVLDRRRPAQHPRGPPRGRRAATGQAKDDRRGPRWPGPHRHQDPGRPRDPQPGTLELSGSTARRTAWHG